MRPVKQLNMAVIGDEDLVSGLRLAGMSRYHIIQDNKDVREDVRKVFTELIDVPEIGIIVLQEDLVKYVEDLIIQVRERKNYIPVIIEIPSKYGTKHQDVTAYYKAYIRKFIGFDIEL